MQTELEKQILSGTLQVFNQKGLKFTLDDVAKELKISKKTIYKVFRSKEEMFLMMVDYCFDGIKESEAAIIADASLSTVEKLKAILGVMPESYKEIQFQNLYQLKDKYPNIYKEVEKHLENGWETTIQLLEQGMQEGVIRQIHIPVFKTMMEATLEQFFQRDVLVESGMRYQDGLAEVVSILLEGIFNK